MENRNLDEETKRQLKIAEIEHALKEERQQAFFIGWIGGGIVLAILLESLLLPFCISITLSAIYAFGFHGKSK
jgi:hypothetical protein